MSKKILILCLLLLSAPKVFSEEPLKMAFLKIYPSPASSELNITNNKPIKDVVIYNMVGQVIFKQTYNAEVIKINISSFAPGMYYVQMDEMAAQRFVKE